MSLQAACRGLRTETTWAAAARLLALASMVARRLGPTEVSAAAAAEWDDWLPAGAWPAVGLPPGLDLQDPGLLGRAYMAWHLPEITGAAAAAREGGAKLDGQALLHATQLFSEPYMAGFLARFAGGATVVDPACGAGELLLAALDAGANHLAGCDLDPQAVALASTALRLRERELVGVIVLDLRFDDGLAAFSGQTFDAVLANPPYLGRKHMSRELARRLGQDFPAAQGDLFAAFLLRALALARPGGTLGFVTMKAWLYQDSFAALRGRYLREATLLAFADLGAEAFDPALALHDGVSVALTCWRLAAPAADHEVQAVKAVAVPGPAAKAARLADPDRWLAFRQADLLEMPGAPFCYDLPAGLRALLARGGDLVGCVKQGLATTENQRFLRFAWEVPPSNRWVPCARGGMYRKWAGLDYELVDWEADGARIKALIPRKYPYLGGWRWVAKNADWYFQPGLTYGYMAYGALGARELDGAVFEVASIGVFPQARDLDRATVFAALNCRTASWMLRALSQKHMFQAGMAERLPLPRFDAAAHADVVELVAWCVAAKRRLLRADPREGACDPTVWDQPVEVALARAQHEAAWLHAAEGALEALVCDGYGLDAEARRHLVAETGVPAGWLPLAGPVDPPPGVPAAVLRHLTNLPGLYPPGEGKPMPAETPIEARALALGVHPLALVHEPPGAAEREAWIEDGRMVKVLQAIGDSVWVLGEDRPDREWLETRFFAYHTLRFKRRPIVWHLASKPSRRGRAPAFGCLVNAHALARLGLAELAALVPAADEETRAFADALRRCAWDPDLDDGVRVNIAPLQQAGLLARPVLPAADVAKAIAQRAAWRADGL
ncbi:MAG: pglX [Cyanobacteria bacterium RYN_339]|nr:pglX [Cyanobacteria bacterium RYN_339]